MLLKINKNSFNVKVLIESSETSEGMMNKTFDNFDGMLFIMGDGSHSFWMMNCIIPLDIIFIDKNFKINKIHHNCEPCQGDDCPSYCGNGNIVLELEGGTCEDLGIEPGDSVSYIL
jgi:uncharacterized membrane protein (UPF0127 family)